MEVNTEVVVGKSGVLCLNNDVLVSSSVDSKRAGEESRAVRRASLLAERVVGKNAGVHADKRHLAKILEEVFFVFFIEVEEDRAFCLGFRKNGLCAAAGGNAADFVLGTVVLDVGNRVVVLVAAAAAALVGIVLVAGVIDNLVSGCSCGIDIGKKNAVGFLSLGKSEVCFANRSCDLRKVDHGIAVCIGGCSDVLFAVCAGVDKLYFNTLFGADLNENSGVRSFDAGNRILVDGTVFGRVSVNRLIPYGIEGNVADNTEGSLDIASVICRLSPA